MHARASNDPGGSTHGKSRSLDEEQERVWRDLAPFFILSPRVLDEDLQRNTGLSLSEYTVLMNLSEAPGRTLLIAELASHAIVVRERTSKPRSCEMLETAWLKHQLLAQAGSQRSKVVPQALACALE